MAAAGRLAALGWLALGLRVDPDAPEVGDVVRPEPTSARPVLDMDYLVSRNLSSGGDVGARLLHTIRKCPGSPEELSVPVWGPHTSGVECYPFASVARGARLAMVKLMAADTSHSFRRLLKAGRTGFSKRDAVSVEAAKNTFSLFRSNMYATVARISSNNKHLVEKLPNILGVRDKLDEAARDARWVQDSGLVIQEVLFSHDGQSPVGRAERFYDVVREAAAAGVADEGALRQALEYLAELGRSAGAVDVALFHDFWGAFIQSASDLQVERAEQGGGELALDEIYERYCEANPAGPLGPGPRVERCVEETRDVNAFIVFAFGVLDPLHQVVDPGVAPVCGSAKEPVALDRWAGPGACYRGEQAFEPRGPHGSTGRPQCCCAPGALRAVKQARDGDEAGEVASKSAERAAEDHVAWEVAPDAGRLAPGAARTREPEYFLTRAAGNTVPALTCGSARLEGTGLGWVPVDRRERIGHGWVHLDHHGLPL